VDKKGQSAGAPTTDVLTVEEDSEFVRLRRKNWARLIAKIWQVEPEICACCGEKIESSRRSRTLTKTTSSRGFSKAQGSGILRGSESPEREDHRARKSSSRAKTPSFPQSRRRT
jgi:hypothetical protein